MANPPNRNANLTQMLYDAATEDKVPVLRDLLIQDPFLLLRPLPSAYTTFPLHIACKNGYLEFVLELLGHNPRLSVDLDSNKSSPLHIASQNGHHELIRPLVFAMPSMCFSRDMLGMTPIHVAAMNGYLSVLEELLGLAPAAAKERVGPAVGSDGGDTVLHLCVKYNQLDALKMVVEKAGEAGFVNAENGEGDTILHLAVANKQLEMVKEMLKAGRLKVNTYNANGLTALDTLEENLNGPNNEIDERLIQVLDEAGCLTSHRIRKNGNNSSWSTQNRGKDDGIMVAAASFIGAAAFQAGLNPPGGVSQDTQTTHTAGMAIMAQLSMPTYQKFRWRIYVCFGYSVTAMMLTIYMPLTRNPSFQRCLIVGMLLMAMCSLFSAYWIADTTLEHGVLAVHTLVMSQPRTSEDSLFMIFMFIIINISDMVDYLAGWTASIARWLQRFGSRFRYGSSAPNLNQMQNSVLFGC